MKRIFVLTLFFCLTFFRVGVADNNHHNTNQEQKAYGGDAEQEQKQNQGQLQGQAQGQVGINKAVGTGNETTVVNEEDTEVNAPTWPETPSTSTKEEKSVYSLFGGFGNNRTEEYVRIERQLKILDAMFEKSLIERDFYNKEVMRLYKQLNDSNKPQKLLGVLSIAQRGCSILNLCGLATW